MKKNNSKIIKLSGTVMSVLLSLQFAQASEITGTINTTLGTTLTAVVLTPRSITTPPPSSGGSGGGSGGGSYSGGGGGGGGSSYYNNSNQNKTVDTDTKKISSTINTAQEKNITQEKSTEKTSQNNFNLNSDNLKFGSTNNDVVNLQKILIAAGLLRTKATGYFGNATKEALIKFQKKNNIATTGLLDKATKNSLSLYSQTDIPVVINDISPNKTALNFTKDLSLGSKNDEVTNLQKILIAQGFLKTKATGQFGSLTKEALIKWQLKNNLPATGYFGQITRNLINKK